MILPKENEKDLAEVPENLRSAMKLHFVETMDQVLAIALEGPLPQVAEETSQAIPAIAPPPVEGPAAHQKLVISSVARNLLFLDHLQTADSSSLRFSE